MRGRNIILCVIAVAVAFKFVLFFHVLIFDPSAIIRIDSITYLNDARGWVDFFHSPAGGLQHSFFRTPGYPFFLALILGAGLPAMSVVFLQIVLNLLTALVVYRTAYLIEPRAGMMSVAIVLWDLPTTIYSTMILTESLYVFLLTLFLFSLLRYLLDRRPGWLLAAALVLALSIYVRPVGYYLGFAIAALIFLLGERKTIVTSVIAVLAFLAIVYGALLPWQYRNLKVHGEFSLCNIDNAAIRMHGIPGRYVRETDPKFRTLSPAVYYAGTMLSNVLKLMTVPGSMKYFDFPAGKAFGKVLGYLLVVFWFVGWVAGMCWAKKNILYWLLTAFVVYFICVTVVSVGWGVGARFRVPMVPALAILAAQGWVYLLDRRMKSHLVKGGSHEKSRQ